MRPTAGNPQLDQQGERLLNDLRWKFRALGHFRDGPLSLGTIPVTSRQDAVGIAASEEPIAHLKALPRFRPVRAPMPRQRVDRHYGEVIPVGSFIEQLERSEIIESLPPILSGVDAKLGYFGSRQAGPRALLLENGRNHLELLGVQRSHFTSL